VAWSVDEEWIDCQRDRARTNADSNVSMVATAHAFAPGHLAASPHIRNIRFAAAVASLATAVGAERGSEILSPNNISPVVDSSHAALHNTREVKSVTATHAGDESAHVREWGRFGSLSVVHGT